MQDPVKPQWCHEKSRCTLVLDRQQVPPPLQSLVSYCCIVHLQAGGGLGHVCVTSDEPLPGHKVDGATQVVLIHRGPRCIV